MNNLIARTLIASICVFAMFMQIRAQNVQVDRSTGKPAITIPICTINSGTLAASISLSYFGTPKVNDSEGSAGMGWSLNAGGEIRRDLRGLPDDFEGAHSGYSGDNRNGWLYGTNANDVSSYSFTGDQNFAICTDEGTDWARMSSFGYNVDTEPDVFYFSAPGLSGKFIFDTSKNPRVIPYQDLSITVQKDANNFITGITITTNQGVVYYFAQGDYVTHSIALKTLSALTHLTTEYYHYINKPVSYYGSWYLKYMKSPVGGRINFTYGNDFTSVSSEEVQFVNSSNVMDTTYTVNDNIVGKRLLTINGSNEIATITWNGAIVSAVSLQDLTYQTITKKYNFQYTSVKASSRAPKRPVRAYLTSYYSSVDCSASPVYKFDYYGVDLVADTTAIPYGTGLGQDIYGYYNNTSTSPVPDIYRENSDAGVNGERYRLVSTSGYSLFSTGGGRSVDPSLVMYGSLKSVTFPTGGVTTIQYESAEYYDAYSNSNINGGGPRVKKVITTGSDPVSNVTVTYRYKSSTVPTRSSGQWTYRPMFVASAIGQADKVVPYNLAPEEVIYYSRVEEYTTGRGHTIYEFQNAGMYGASASGDFNPSLTRLARYYSGSCTPAVSAHGGYYTFPFAPNTDYNFERGLPLRISQYNSVGKLLSRTINTFQRTSSSTGSVQAIKFEAYANSYQCAKYSYITNTDKALLTSTVRQYEIPAATDTVGTNYVETSTTYTYNGNQMLSQIASTNSDNITAYQLFKYAKDYPSTGTDSMCVALGYLNSGLRHGTLIETISKKGSSYIGGALNLFRISNAINGYNTSTNALPAATLILGDPTSFAPSSITGSAFISAPGYYFTGAIDAWDTVGNPIRSISMSRKYSGVIMGYRATAPALEISNGRGDQVVYSDFEPYISSAVAGSYTATATDAWSGKKSASLTSSTNIARNGILKATGNYRFSCWMKASAASQLTVTATGTGGSSSVNVTYPSSAFGQWAFVEGTLGMSSITGSTFDFALTLTGASAYIDNMAFYPESADIVSHAYDPIYGKLSDHDSRGNSGFVEYDPLGRTHYLKNQDKDIVQINEYHFKTQVNAPPVSRFNGPASPNIGSAYNFTVTETSCGTVTYTWYVDGVQQSPPTTPTTLPYVFSVFKEYRVKLKASSDVGGISYTEMEVHPVPAALSATISGQAGQPTNFDCHDNLSRTVSVTVTGCVDTTTDRYEWFYSIGSSGGTPTSLGSTSTPTLTFNLQSGVDTYIHCIVYASCKDQTTGDVYVYPINPSVVKQYTYVSGNGC